MLEFRHLRRVVWMKRSVIRVVVITRRFPALRYAPCGLRERRHKKPAATQLPAGTLPNRFTLPEPATDCDTFASP